MKGSSHMDKMFSRSAGQTIFAGGSENTERDLFMIATIFVFQNASSEIVGELKPLFFIYCEHFVYAKRENFFKHLL
jgi:hypothetical protein